MIKLESVRVCPDCGENSISVIDTRPDKDGLNLRRKRCNSCGFTWGTVEISMEDFIMMKEQTEIAKRLKKPKPIRIELTNEELTVRQGSTVVAHLDMQ